MTKGTIVIAGALAQKPYRGGHTWVFLQYLLGFMRLGWEVLFLDQLEPEMCIDEAGRPCPIDRSLNLRYFRDVMEGFGLDNAFALICAQGERWIGLSRQQVCDRIKVSAALLNVMGFLRDEEILGLASRCVFLDIDPGFGQMWRENGLYDLFRGHDYYVTIGANINQANCAIPSCGLSWIITRPPIVLDLWPQQPVVDGGSITSIASWRGAYAPLAYRDQIYGLRVHEFRKFAQLAHLANCSFELALDIHPDEVKDLALLADSGWSLVDPSIVTGDPWSYQAYIQHSRAEFMVAKNMYVRTNSGWFSDRSICYLATGRPVLAQDTGIRHIYPTGEGLVTFTTLDEALAGVEEIARDLVRHSRAARALAEEYFDSSKVLGQLLSKLHID